MRRNFKIITTALSLVALFVGICNTANAVSINGPQYDSYCNSPELEQYGAIDKSASITIDGVINPLYYTFVDANYATSRAKDLAKDAIIVLREYYNLGEFTENNFSSYSNAVNAALSNSSDDDFQAVNSQLIALRSFLEIYSDYSRNDNIRDYLDEATAGGPLTSSQKFELGIMLPYYAPLAIEASAQAQSLAQRARSLPNLSAAVSYAERYAWTPNEAEYGIARASIFWEADCTNFASQILEASGVRQVVYNDVNLGWWHKKSGNSHTWSSSWINADVFSRYMGVGYTTTNHRNFAQNIAVGDFIALDHENNDTWDHLGFVTYQDSAERQYGGRTYRNYIIAQHTENYNRWVSEDGNNWELAGERGGRYGRVRR